MSKRVGLAFAALLFTAGAASATAMAPPTPNTSLDVERHLLLEASKKFKADDSPGAAPLLKAAIASPAFAKLNDDQRYIVLTTYGTVLLQTEDSAGALVQLRAATGFSQADGAVWSLRFLAAQTSGNLEDALLSLTALAQRWPEALASLPDESIYYVARDTRTRRPLASGRIALLEALDRAGWTPKNIDISVDHLWMDLTLAVLDRGEADKAGAVARKVVDPENIADMRVDRRFDPVTTKDPAWFDVGAASERRMQFLTAALKAAPDSLAGVTVTARLLLAEARTPEVVALLDGAIKRTQAEGAAPFTDQDAELHVTYDILSAALLLQGRDEESIAAMQAGARLQEQGQTNVSQQLDLGVRYVELGRPDDALAAVSSVDLGNVSGFGRTVLETIHAMASAAKKDGPATAAAVSYLKAHADDSPVNLVEVLAVVGDDEGAAQQTIKLLADPLDRREILSLMQDAITPDAEPEFDKALRRKIVALRDRPDVKAAIARVGRIERRPLLGDRL